MEGKKISFGFMKTKKAEKTIIEEKREYIECVEEKSIKVVGGETIEENVPLVIPMKPNTLVAAERLKQIAEEVEKAVEEQPEPGGQPKVTVEEQAPLENETLEQMAVRELLHDAKNKKVVEETAKLMMTIPSKPVTDGQEESTLDDYETVPIQEFGMAMLRGMGWTPGKDTSKYKLPQLRPKGLGLGADKVVKENQKKNESKNKDDDLAIVNNAFVKVTTGKYSGYYGKVLSLDEDNGRVMIDIPVKKETVSLSEFMMQPVTKLEFDKQSRVINADTYDEYKKNEQTSERSSKHNSPKTNEREESSSQRPRDNDTKEYTEEKRKDENNRTQRDYEKPSNGKSRDKDKLRHKRDSSRSKERSIRRERKYSSSSSLSSLSDSERRNKYKESRRRHSSTESDSSDSYRKYKKKNKKNKNKSSEKREKRDIDKKRKGKKKKRDRDRSPNCRKYKK